MIKGRKIGLALGSGSARGWAHIGVIRALEERGIKPDIVCGTSIGAVVGGIYSGGQITEFETWVRKLEWRDILSLLDLSWGGGLFKGKKLLEYLSTHFQDKNFQDLEIPFGCVATDVDTGAEVWLRKGKVLEAIRGSISLPAIFTPTSWEGKWLVDGGLTNPVPVSLCRAMGADLVIAVDLNMDLLDAIPKEQKQSETNERRFLPSFWGKDLEKEFKENQDKKPGMMDIIQKSINVMQVRITRSRMAGDPPDVLLAPKLGYLGLMEFHRAEETIREGKNVVDRSVELDYYFPREVD